MKKFFISLMLGLALIPITAPIVTHASNTEVVQQTVRPLIPKPETLVGPESVDTAGNTISGVNTQNYVLNVYIPNAINLVLGLFGIGTFLAFVVSALMMLTSLGNEDQFSKAKRNLQWSLIGFALSLLAYAIVSIIVSVALPSSISVIDKLIPSAHAAVDIDTLLPTENQLISGQDPNRGVSLPTGNFLTEVLPAIISQIMFLVGFLIFIGFCYGGILMVIGRGNEDMVTKAKNIVLYASMSLAILGFGYAIVYGLATLRFDEDPNSTADDVFVDIRNQ